MADVVLDQGRNSGAQTAEDGAAAGAPAAATSGGLKAWLPLIITVVLMPVLAFVTTRFVILPKMQKALEKNAPLAAPAQKTEADTKDAAAATPGKTKFTVPMTKILVNVAGTMGTRYLMCSFTLVGSDPDFKSKVDENHDQLTDLAQSTLNSKTISDLEKPGARNVIRAELTTTFNNALGGPWIKEIYITELAIQ